jgi:predicted nucleic acid-binding protein
MVPLNERTKVQMNERLFLDTFFIQALFNKRDQHHPKAKKFFPRLKNAQEVWTTEAVLIEIGNALSIYNRDLASTFIGESYTDNQMKIVSVDTVLLKRGLTLYQERKDKSWGLTDCISFIVMGDQQLTDALTADIHFVQAGFRALLRN